MANNYHYYQKEQSDLHSNPNVFDFNFKGLNLKYKTDDGVFSKKYIDYGSFVMLNTYVPNKLEGPVLDMGAGYGALGITISKLYDQNVHMCEINERAYNLIKENAKMNKADNVVVYHSDLFEALPEEQKFASIVTNPPIRAGKQVVFAIYDGSYERLVSGGELWVVIQKKQGAPSSKTHLEELFGNCEIVNKDKGYYILKSVKK